MLRQGLRPGKRRAGKDRRRTEEGLQAVDRGLSALHAYFFPSWVSVVVAGLKGDRSV